MSALRRIQITKGVAQTESFDLVDLDGNPFSAEQLVGAIASFVARVTAEGENALSIVPAISMLESKMIVTVSSGATASLAVGPYLYRATLTLSDASIRSVADWSPLDLVLGGSATPTPPVFEATIKLDHDYMLSGDLAYRTPGGSPISDAQIRVYRKSDYDAGLLGSPVGVTTTDADGKWREPILVVPGYEYAVRFECPNEYGPDVVYVTAV